MVTGSVGKTSTKDAVAAALSENFYLRKSEKSFNSELGVPLTIIGASNPWSNPTAWLSVFAEALSVLIFPTHYPKLLVLEVGADQPGDLKKILKIATPDAVVVTLLPSVPVHVEAYETPAAVREEEFAPALALAPGAPLIVSADDEFARKLARQNVLSKVTFGLSEDADLRITDVELWTEAGATVPKGMKAKLIIKGKEHCLNVPHVIGRSQVLAPAAAVLTGLMFGMTVEDAFKGLASYVPPQGRGRLFEGKKNSILIDDTYNSSPAAVEEILRSHSLLSAEGRSHRRIVAVLGDMLELGRYSVAEHARIGHIANECVDVLVTVGVRARTIGEAAIESGMSAGSVHHFATSMEAVAPIEELLQEGDVVLVKGSQGVRMERIVRPLLANFEDVPELVRQSPEWLKR